MLVYVGLILATVLVAQPGPAAAERLSTVSPVVIDSDTPAIRVGSLIQRSDI